MPTTPPPLRRGSCHVVGCVGVVTGCGADDEARVATSKPTTATAATTAARQARARTGRVVTPAIVHPPRHRPLFAAPRPLELTLGPDRRADRVAKQQMVASAPQRAKLSRPGERR